jgi:hypothetical protein
MVAGQIGYTNKDYDNNYAPTDVVHIFTQEVTMAAQAGAYAKNVNVFVYGTAGDSFLIRCALYDASKDLFCRGEQKKLTFAITEYQEVDLGIYSSTALTASVVYYIVVMIEQGHGKTRGIAYKENGGSMAHHISFLTTGNYYRHWAASNASLPGNALSTHSWTMYLDWDTAYTFADYMVNIRHGPNGTTAAGEPSQTETAPADVSVSSGAATTPWQFEEWTFDDGAGDATDPYVVDGVNGNYYDLFASWEMATVTDPTVDKTGKIYKYFGLQDWGGTSEIDLPTNYKTVNKYTVYEPIQVKSLWIIGGSGGGGAEIGVRGIIYSDSSGSPDALLATSQPLEWTNDMHLAASHKELPFESPIVLDAGTYWIGIITQGDGDFTVKSETDSTTTRNYLADTMSDGAADPFGGGASTDTKRIPCYAQYLSVNPLTPVESYTVADTSNIGKGAIRWSNKSFHANDRLWFFYVGYDMSIYLTTSDDKGLTWSTPVEQATRSIERYGENLAVCYDSDNDRVHVAYRDTVAGTTYLYYRSGVPNTNDGSPNEGTITWTAAWAQAWADPGGGGTINADFHMALDTEGYPWLSWSYGAGVSNAQPYVSKSSTKNGTWTTEGGYPYQVDATADGHTNNQLVAMANSKMYVLYGEAGDVWHGNLFNGVTWSSQETVTTNGKPLEQYASGNETWSRPAVATSNDDIHMIFLDMGGSGGVGYAGAQSNVFSWNLRHVRRDATDGWQADTIIVENLKSKGVSPCLTVKDHLIHLFFSGDAEQNHILHLKYDWTTDYWHPIERFRVNEFTDTIPVDVVAASDDLDGTLSAFTPIYDVNWLGAFFMGGTGGSGGDEFVIKFAKFMGSNVYATVDTNDYPVALRKFEELGGSADVTLQSLTLGAVDSDTGWFTPSYSDSSISMIINVGGAISRNLNVGYFTALDAIGMTQTYAGVGDRILDDASRVWLIESVKPCPVGKKLFYYTCELREVHQLG